MAEQIGADWTDDDADAIDADGRRRCGKLRQLEEDIAPNRRGNYARNQEIILLDDGAHDTRERYLVDLRLAWAQVFTIVIQCLLPHVRN